MSGNLGAGDKEQQAFSPGISGHRLRIIAETVENLEMLRSARSRCLDVSMSRQQRQRRQQQPPQQQKTTICRASPSPSPFRYLSESPTPSLQVSKSQSLTVSKSQNRRLIAIAVIDSRVASSSRWRVRVRTVVPDSIIPCSGESGTSEAEDAAVPRFPDGGINL
ncbi:uncharacterized protein BP5553_06168 [Venustampulla echinocandica]|uniref:Uncharacterized protein n=1 Tax=Venustampulla echinocandica TaxID=2656787 RepID=A0A370TMR5_9HELO|nr:uncharacterized protein BP5553_06168 [Venustampulla echinocandica]RDL36816.1 hypothetical protein BP5553_06168 [Venustampulla echinocandica]